jgi:transcriptional regulator with XRE-family HTH domain
MPKKQTYNSISEVVRETSERTSFADAVEGRLSRRRIVKDLKVLRATQGLSQKDIAEKLGCTQSRISELESMIDANLRIGDISKYADVLGLELRIILESTDRSPVARAKKQGVALDATRERARRRSVSTRNPR